jgi:hypothetical protein
MQEEVQTRNTLKSRILKWKTYQGIKEMRDNKPEEFMTNSDFWEVAQLNNLHGIGQWTRYSNEVTMTALNKPKATK